MNWSLPPASADRRAWAHRAASRNGSWTQVPPGVGATSSGSRWCYAGARTLHGGARAVSSGDWWARGKKTKDRLLARPRVAWPMKICNARWAASLCRCLLGDGRWMIHRHRSVNFLDVPLKSWQARKEKKKRILHARIHRKSSVIVSHMTNMCCDCNQSLPQPREPPKKNNRQREQNIKTQMQGLGPLHK